MIGHVVVAGAGISGAATALALAERGFAVTLLDRAAAGAAVSGASLACLGTHMSSEIELPQLIWATRRWAEWDKRFAGAFHYRRCGQIRFIDHEADIPVAEKWIAFERAAGLAPELLNRERLRAVEPALTGPLVAASWSPSDALVNPFLAVRCLIRAACEAGARFNAHCPVEAIEVAAGRVTGVVTPRGRIAADAVVVTGGPWTADILAPLGITLPILPRKAQCLATIRQPATIRGVVGGCKSDHGGVDAGYTQIQQSEAGQILFNTVLAGGLSEAGAQDHVPEVDRRFVRDSIDTLTRLFPALREVELLRSWVRYEAVTPDDRFIVGAVGPAGLLVAAGDNGTGFCRAPVIGELIAATLAGMAPAVDPSPYDPARFGPGGTA